METVIFPEKCGHAVFDAVSRKRKADKILGILKNRGGIEGRKVLEIGTGSGYMSAHFAKAAGQSGSLSSVDVVDQREVKEGYAFQLVDGVKLPFANETFDVVISNHVIEHVGERNEQSLHLREIFRVLVKGGFAYLATPNRYKPIEPHYNLPFLGIMPVKVAGFAVSTFGKGNGFEIRSFGPISLNRLAEGAGFSVESAVREMVALSLNDSALKFLSPIAEALPRVFFSALIPICPSFVIVLKKPS